MDKLLQKYKCAPSQAEKAWPPEFWKDEKKVTEHIEPFLITQKAEVGKGKGVICAVLGACVSCAQQESQESQVSSPPRQIANTEFQAMESENKMLKSSLASEKQTGEQLGARC